MRNQAPPTQVSGTAGDIGTETIIIDTTDIAGIAGGSYVTVGVAYQFSPEGLIGFRKPVRRELAQLTDKTDKNLKEITVWLIYSAAVQEHGKG